MATLKKTENWFSIPIRAYCRSKVLQNAPRGAFCNTMTFIKLPFVIKIFVLSIFEGPFYTGFMVFKFLWSEVVSYPGHIQIL